ncbi:MAG: flagellar biosynthesis anti-sigma factor FlgM [Gammaproteobacteria bacterium]|nr:flagellar biosynthesis anti-sigma factor FlgM [Gammaproteobacteria bacterium]
MPININNSPVGNKVTGIQEGGQLKHKREQITELERENKSSDDSLTLTPIAQHLKAVESQLAMQPVVDENRVAAVRAKIERGEFDFNPERIADKLLQLEKQINEKLGES